MTQTHDENSYPSAALLASCIDAALGAGERILEIYGRDFAVDLKSDSTPVTAADRAAEAFILARIAEFAPDIPVVAEESVAEGRVPAFNSRLFLVDPLDGTREFVSRNGEFTVNIALVENGVPVFGVVYAPVVKILFAGDVRSGAWRADIDNGKVINRREINVRPPRGGLRVVASRSHMSDETRALIDRLDVSELVSAGSSLKFGLVAAGEADFYPRLGRTMQWDTAAGDAVLRAAGGEVRDLAGVPLMYGRRGVGADPDFANPWFVAGGRDLLSAAPWA